MTNTATASLQDVLPALEHGAIHGFSSRKPTSTSTANADFELISAFARQIEGSYPSADEYPYHNFVGHITPMRAIAANLCEAARDAGIPVNSTVVDAAVLGHDAFVHLNPEPLKLLSKETVAGVFSGMILQLLGASDDTVSRVVAAIQATNKQTTPKTLEEKIVRYADIASVAASHDRFLIASQQLYRESLNGGHQAMTYEQFFTWQVQHVLADYLTDPMELIPPISDTLGRSLWHAGALENIARTKGAGPDITLVGFDSVTDSLMIQLARTSFQSQGKPFGTTWILALTENQKETANDVRTQLHHYRSKFFPYGLGLAVPTNPEVFPISTGFCESCHARFQPASNCVNEVVRITNPCGMIYWYVLPQHAELFKQQAQGSQRDWQQVGVFDLSENEGNLSTRYLVFACKPNESPSNQTHSWKEKSKPEEPYFGAK